VSQRFDTVPVSRIHNRMVDLRRAVAHIRGLLVPLTPEAAMKTTDLFRSSAFAA
jgi:hypothetical protein